MERKHREHLHAARRAGHHRAPRPLLWRSLLLGTAALGGCFQGTFPLGGVSSMQGRPLPARSFQLGLGLGKLPGLIGAVPDLGAPILGDRSATDTKFFLTVGAGLNEWVDVGISSSRGLYSTVKLVRAGPWSLSVSPAYFRATDDSTYAGDDTWNRTSNLNLTGLLAFQSGEAEGVSFEAYAGSGINWYDTEIRHRWRTHSGRTPTLLAGLAIDGVGLDLWRPAGSDTTSVAPSSRRPQDRDVGSAQAARISIEITRAWITQREGGRDFVTVGRVMLALRSWPAW